MNICNSSQQQLQPEDFQIPPHDQPLSLSAMRLPKDSSIYMKIEKHDGWCKAILDDDCGFSRFYDFANLIESKFGLQFNNQLHDFDSLFWDFEFNGSTLSLQYNIFIVVSVVPSKLKQATTEDNKNTISFGRELFTLFNDMFWAPFEKSNPIGTRGSESGIIVEDIEHTRGTRLTLEKSCGNIPFALTLGIYGTMFHTKYLDDLNTSNEYIHLYKCYVNKYFDLHELSPNINNYTRENKRHKILEDLTNL